MTACKTERFAANHRPMATHGDPRLHISALVNGHSNGNGYVPEAYRPEVYRCSENGRVYYAYRGHVVCPFPCDESEKRRLDQFHHLIHALGLNGKLFIADLNTRTSTRPQILDVGFGTGVWALDMGSEFPNMDVFGIDLIDNQPRLNSPAPNVSFQTPVDFNTRNWGFRANSFDLIRMAQLCGCVSDWSAQYRTVYSYLKPGTGFIEHIEVDWEPRCSIVTGFPSELKAVRQWWEWMKEASWGLGRPIEYRENTERLLEDAGFTDISHKTIRISLQTQRRDERNYHIKRVFQSLMCVADENDGGEPEAFESLSMSLLTRQLKMPVGTVRELCEVLRKIYASEKAPLFHNLHVWTARKPMT